MIIPFFMALAATADIPASSAVWVHLPSEAQFASAYPARTETPDQFDIDLRCRITDGAGRVSCIVVGESPAGYGVGPAAASLFTRFARLDMRRTPGSAPGRVVIMHYRIRPASS